MNKMFRLAAMSLGAALAPSAGLDTDGVPFANSCAAPRGKK